VKRREFIAGLGSTAAWPVVARAQQADRVRRIGVLIGGDENDPVYKGIVSTLTQALGDLGWTNGRNLRIDLRQFGDDINRSRALAQELVGLQPDMILTSNTPATAALQRETGTIPIVFVGATDPAASGLLARLDRPGGNITGFAHFEPTLAGKWLELLTERLKRRSSPWGASREVALSSIQMHGCKCIARRSYRRRPETTYRRSMGYLNLSETVVCSPTDPTG